MFSMMVNIKHFYYILHSYLITKSGQFSILVLKSRRNLSVKTSKLSIYFYFTNI